MAEELRNQPRIELYLKAVQSHEYTPSDVGLFMYDFDSLYELLRLGLDPHYADFQFSRFVLYRDHRQLEYQDRMRVSTLSLRSPLEILTLIPVLVGAVAGLAATVWALVQTIEKIRDRPFNRETRELDIQMRRLEILKLIKDLGAEGWDLSPSDEHLETLLQNAGVVLPSQEQVRQILESRNALRYVDMVSGRLSRSPVAPEEFRLAVRQPERGEWLFS